MNLKNISLVVVAGLVLFFAFNYFKEPSITNYPSSGKTIVAFGDSLVEGFGAANGADFPSILSRRIGRPVVNLGRGGDTTESALKRISDVVNKEPKVVMVLLGGNDHLRQVPKAETKRNLGEIVKIIQRAGAVVVLVGVKGGIFKNNFGDMYEDLSREYGTVFVPNILSGIIGNASLMHDSIHPNDKGYEKIADRIYQVLKEFLE